MKGYRQTLFKLILYFLALAITALTVLPVLWLLIGSLRLPEDLFESVFPVTWKTFMPFSLTLQNFFDASQEHPLARFVLNSLIVAGSSVFIGLFVNSLAAYSLARFKYPGRDFFFIIILMTLMMPFRLTVIPLFLIVKSFGWINTYRALIIPMVCDGVSIFLLRQFFIEIPKSIEESAIIDGASYFTIYLKIMLPLAKPAFLTAGLLQFLAVWDSFMWPLVVVSSSERTVFQVGLGLYIGEWRTSWGSLLAASVVGVAPVIGVFLALQKYYVKGITLTGIKF